MESEERVLDIIFDKLKQIEENQKSIEAKVDQQKESIIQMQERSKNNAAIISVIISAIGLIISAIISAFKNHP